MVGVPMGRGGNERGRRRAEAVEAIGGGVNCRGRRRTGAARPPSTRLFRAHPITSVANDLRTV